MVNHTYDEKISAWLESNRERIMEQWMNLVRIPSVHGEAKPGAPFGEACAQAVKTAADYFAQQGISVRLGENNTYALAHIGEGEKTICLFGHSDVVPAGDGWIFTEPFQPVIKEGMLIGRGCSDNKSGVVASLCVLSMLKELNIPLHNRIQAYVGSNEESGMADIEVFVKNEAMPDLSLVPDSGFPCSLGEKGILRMWTKCGKPLSTILDMRGGNAFNIVLDHVDTVLAPNAALAAELQEKCAGDIAYTLQVEADGTILLGADGVAQHAAHAQSAINATWLTAKLLADCENLNAQDRQIMQTVAELLAGYDGAPLGIAHSDEDFGILTAANGMVAVEDSFLKVSLDIRYGASLDPEKLETGLYTAWEAAGWQIVYMNNRPGFRVDPQSPVPEMLKGIYHQLSGNENGFYFMQGGTYSRYLKNAFTVGTCIRAAGREPLGSFLPKGHGGAHQRDEAIDIEGFFLAIRTLAHYVLACDEHLSK